MARASESPIPSASPRGWRSATSRGLGRARHTLQSPTALPAIGKGAWVEDGEITELRLAREVLVVLEDPR